MEESTLFKISLIFSVIGILVIIFLAGSLEAKELAISELKSSMVDQEVKITGSIFSIRKTTGPIILTIKDESGIIPVVLFDNAPNFNKNEKVEVIGDVSEFNNQLQLTAKTIKTS